MKTTPTMKIALLSLILATFTAANMTAALPDPLLMRDGTPVKTPQDWQDKRRPELKALFQDYMYGQLPPKPEKIHFKVEGEHDDFLDGKARLKFVEISFDDPKAPKIDLMLVIPKATKSAPTFLVLNFCGNHAITDDKRVPLLRGWAKCSPNHRATDGRRGTQASEWPLGEIVGRGYAVATFCNSDVDSDRADVSDGVYKWLNPDAPTHHRGTIAAWAWGFHRAMDYLVTDKAIDAKRVAALGHSRNGKTALLAAAMDERFALAIPHQAGCGGTAPSRSNIGESVKQINDYAPHWFNAEFKKFNDAPEKLPFDQNCLVALMAPRPVLFSNAVKDQHANPNGQFEVLQAAEPVYKLLKAGGVEAEKMPELGKLVNSKLGYFIRPGGHSMTLEDWIAFLEFADKQM
jgi:hypothetical protein